MDIDITRYETGQIKPFWLEHNADQEIIVPPKARVSQPICVLHLIGALDGTAYDLVVQTARTLIVNGVRRIIADLTGVESISSAGLIALYSVGSILEGGALYDLDGYGVLDAMRNDIESDRVFRGLVLIAPRGKAALQLSSSAFDMLAVTYSSVEDAISAFPD